jgi:hypothetical protein
MRHDKGEELWPNNSQRQTNTIRPAAKCSATRRTEFLGRFETDSGITGAASGKIIGYGPAEMTLTFVGGSA